MQTASTSPAPLSREHLLQLGVKFSKNGRIVASKKNWERLKGIPFRGADGSYFDGMIDGQSNAAYTVEQALEVAATIIGRDYCKGMYVSDYLDFRTREQVTCLNVYDHCDHVSLHV